MCFVDREKAFPGYTVMIKGLTWSATMIRSPVTFKQFSVGAKESKVCQANNVTVILSSVFAVFNLFEKKKQQQQENIPHVIIPPAA